MKRLSKLLPLAVNIALPLLIYHYVAPHFGERNGLILSSIPPILWSVIELASFRRLNAVSLLAVIGIFLSLAAMALGGNPRLLLARESLVTGIIGLLFLGSLLLPRPLIFYLARSTMAKETAEAAVRFESYWLRPRFMRSMYTMTWVWGLGLVFEAALRFWLAFAWPVEQFLAISPFISYGIYFSLMGWSLWYANAMRSGDLISGFMKRIGLADRVIVVLSDKYLHSPYCVTELYSIYQRSLEEKADFLRRIIPLVLDDARFGTPEERVQYAKHWQARYLKLKSDLEHVSVEDFRLYKAMQKWYLDIGDMLCYLNDVLTPHRQMLTELK